MEALVGRVMTQQDLPIPNHARFAIGRIELAFCRDDFLRWAL